MPIILISGEPYQAFLARDKSRRSFKERGYAYQCIDAIADDNALAVLERYMHANNLFGKPKYVEVKIDNYDCFKDFFKLTSLHSPIDAALFFAPGQKKPNVSAKAVTFLHFELPQGAALQAFIAKEASRRNCKLSPQVIGDLALLPKKTGDLFSLVNEIEKVSLAPAYAQELLCIQKEDTPFAITDALSKKNTARALTFLEKEFCTTQKPVDVLNRILWQLRVLLIVSNYKLPATSYQLPFHPFVIKKARQAQGLFSLSELIELYKRAIWFYERLLFSGLPSRILLSQFFWKM